MICRYPYYSLKLSHNSHYPYFFITRSRNILQKLERQTENSTEIHMKIVIMFCVKIISNNFITHLLLR